MRKAGEVTFVDAHRPTKNEGWVAVFWVEPFCIPNVNCLSTNFSFHAGWLSLHPGVTWRMPYPSLMGQNWTVASWRCLRTAESKLFFFCFILGCICKLCGNLQGFKSVWQTVKRDLIFYFEKQKHCVVIALSLSPPQSQQEPLSLPQLLPLKESLQEPQPLQEPIQIRQPDSREEDVRRGQGLSQIPVPLQVSLQVPLQISLAFTCTGSGQTVSPLPFPLSLSLPVPLSFPLRLSRQQTLRWVHLYVVT